jgi:hypothetical protein
MRMGVCPGEKQQERIMKYVGGIKITVMALAAALVAGSGWAGSVDDGLLFYAPLDGALEVVLAAGAASPSEHRDLQFVEGRFGQAVHLTGRARLYYRGGANFNFLEGTVAFWANRDVVWGQRKSCTLFKVVGGPGWNRNALYFIITSSNRLRVWLYDDESRAIIYMTQSLPEHPEEWYHLAFTFKDGEVRIFVNGEEGEYTSDGRGDPLMLMPDVPVPLLQFGSDYDHSFEGRFDELRVYGRVLSPEEIRALFEWEPGAPQGEQG